MMIACMQRYLNLEDFQGLGAQQNQCSIYGMIFSPDPIGSLLMSENFIVSCPEDLNQGYIKLAVLV